jgi:aryl-alcohol dehydrogenase-like predicted oxidoreductase
VSELGLGLAALGRPAYINLGHGADLRGQTDTEALEENAHSVLDEAYDGGVRFFDAARSYGLAEAFLASWLERRRLAPADVFVGSKWGYTYTAGWRRDAEQHEVKDLSAATFRRQLAETLDLLGNHLRLYQIHSATLESGVLDDRELLGELEQLRADGIEIGITVTGTEQAATIERALELEPFSSVQATWNLLERSAETALATAHAAGVRVIVKEALANGRLAGRELVEPLEHAARLRGTTPDVLALSAAFAQPWADVVLSGATTRAMLRRNVDARQVGFDAEELDALREEPGGYWSTRASLPWN